MKRRAAGVVLRMSPSGQVERVFLLSPARCSGPRANLLPRSQGELGAGEGAALCDVFRWLSRGGVLLRAVRADVGLEYVPVQSSLRRGARPPRLGKLR